MREVPLASRVDWPRCCRAPSTTRRPLGWHRTVHTGVERGSVRFVQTQHAFRCTTHIKVAECTRGWSSTVDGIIIAWHGPVATCLRSVGVVDGWVGLLGGCTRTPSIVQRYRSKVQSSNRRCRQAADRARRTEHSCQGGGWCPALPRVLFPGRQKGRALDEVLRLSN